MAFGYLAVSQWVWRDFKQVPPETSLERYRYTKQFDYFAEHRVNYQFRDE